MAKTKSLEDQIPSLVRISCGRMTVTTKDRVEGVESTAHGDSFVRMHVGAREGTSPMMHRWALADALESLAKQIRSTHDDLDGSAEIVVLRRYSSRVNKAFADARALQYLLDQEAKRPPSKKGKRK